MRKIIVINLLMVILALIVPTLTYSQEVKIDPNFIAQKEFLFLSNSVKSDTINPSTSLRSVTNNIYELMIWKVLPNTNKDSINSTDIKGKDFDRTHNSQRTEINIKFDTKSVVEASITRKSMHRKFNADYQISLPIKTFQFTISDTILHPFEKIKGSFKAHLPIEFGWMHNDTIIEVNFQTKIYVNKYKKKVFDIPQKNSLKIVSNLKSDTTLYRMPAKVYLDTLLNKCLLQVGNNDGLGGKFISLFFYKKPFIVSKIIFDDYSDIDKIQHLESTRYKIEFNKNPFDITNKNALIGNFIISTDKLPQRYGDAVVEGNTFKCDTLIYKTLEDF